MKIKELVATGQFVHFLYFRKGDLWYRTTSGFVFPVPVSDCGDGTFMAEDRAITFMRYIRKQLEAVDAQACS